MTVCDGVTEKPELVSVAMEQGTHVLMSLILYAWTLPCLNTFQASVSSGLEEETLHHQL